MTAEANKKPILPSGPAVADKSGAAIRKTYESGGRRVGRGDPFRVGNSQRLPFASPRVFNKPRDLMTEDELLQVLQYVQNRMTKVEA